MIATNRRRQFGKVDDRIKVIHPKWWYVKFKTSTNNQVVFNYNSDFSFSLKEIVSSPDNGTITTDNRNIKATVAGTYEIYFTLSVWSNTAMYHALNCVSILRLPNPYSSNDYLRPLYGYYGGGTQTTMTYVYLTRNNPPSGPSNTALNAQMAPKLTVYIPSGSLQNYVGNSNTAWNTLYNAGRLIEVKYNIIND